MVFNAIVNVKKLLLTYGVCSAFFDELIIDNCERKKYDELVYSITLCICVNVDVAVAELYFYISLCLFDSFFIF